MIRQSIGLVLCLIFSFKAIAQLVPFEKESLFGVCDVFDNVLFDAEFEGVKINLEFGLVSLLKNDHWGVYDESGKEILSHVIPAKKGYYGPGIESARRFGTYDSKDEIKSGLLKFTDYQTQNTFYINPNNPIRNPLPYVEQRDKLLTQLYSNRYLPKGFITKVYAEDGMSNFLDTLGQAIFEKNVHDGVVLSNELIAVYNGTFYSLYNSKGERLNDFRFRIINQIETLGLISAEEFSDEKNYQKRYFLFNRKGELIRTSYVRFSTCPKACLVQDSSGFELVNGTGKTIKSFENLRANYLFVTSNTRYIITQEEDKFGILDDLGKRILPDSFLSIRKDYYQNLSLKSDQGISILDSNLNLQFRMDSVSILEKHRVEGFYLFEKQGKKGIINKDEEIIVASEYDMLKDLRCMDFVVCGKYSDSIKTVKRLSESDFKIEFVTRNDVVMNCVDSTFIAKKNGEQSVFDYKGKYLRKYEKPQFNKNYYESKYKPKKLGDESVLLDKNDNQVLPQSFLDIKTSPKIIDSNGKVNQVYFCQTTKESEFPNCKVYNDQLEEFIPAGYTFPNRWRYKMMDNPDVLVVVNEADALKDKYNCRIALIDYEGNWIMKPFYGRFVHIDKDLFAFTIKETKSVVLHNAHGKRLGEYDLLYAENSNSVQQNRIMVGNFVSNLTKAEFYEILDGKEIRKEYDKANQIKNNLKQSKELIKILDKRNKKLDELASSIQMVYGYIDAKGNLKLPLQFTQANSFVRDKEHTFVSKHNLKGEINSFLIDTSGNVQFSAPFEKMDYLGESHFKALKDNKYCIVDSTGQQQTEFKFESIYNVDNRFLASEQDEHYLITDTYDLIKVGTSDKVQWRKVNDDLFYIQLSNKIEDSYSYSYSFHLFNKNFERLKVFENISEIKSQFYHNRLPNSHVAVKVKNDKKYLVYNTLTGKYIGK